jgi:DNA (cytosine-5)-methyltransferase 1
MSIAGKMNQNDPRNKLITYVISFIKRVKPETILIENVPGILKFNILINNEKIKILDYIQNELEPLGYIINYSIKNAADYGTAQSRKRAIFLISRIGKWNFPREQKRISVRQMIGKLPSLEAGEKSTIHAYHYAIEHNKKQIL